MNRKQKTRNQKSILNRPRVALLAALTALTALLTAGACRSIVRNVGCLRAIFYPPRVDMKKVDMKKIDLETGTGPSFDHSAYEAVLKEFVNDAGHVNYGGLSKNTTGLDEYIKTLAAQSRADFEALSAGERLALLLNAYNAFTLRLILDHKGVASIRDIPTQNRWVHKRWKTAGLALSLDDLEHKIIRPEYGDPRIHFALVCAAESCPRLRAEAYVGARLSEQLDDQARHYFSQAGNFKWDRAQKRLSFSELLDWYRDDFLSRAPTLVDFTLPYLDPRTAEEIKAAGQADITHGWLDYSWMLNGAW